jgi:hypothetical protein
MLEAGMQKGSLIRSCRKRGPDVWQFRWADKGPFGKRIYRRRVIGTVCQYADAESARKSVAGLLTEINTNAFKRYALPMTIAEVCDHFIQRELASDNLWRSYSTKRAYKAYIRRWIAPHWGRVRLSEVRTVEVEEWLRRLPLAKSSCAKIRNILSVLFNHACRHELFNRNPIRLEFGMRTIVFRVLGGVVGLFAGTIAIVGPLLFISNELQEADSARQYGGHASFVGAVGGSLTVLVLAGFFAFIAFVLLRFSLRGSKPH